MTEKERIEEVVRGAGLPDYVERFEIELGEDATGDPAAWVWVILSDQEAESDSFDHVADEVYDKIWAAFRETEIERWWPYVRFRTVSEHAALSGGK